MIAVSQEGCGLPRWRTFKDSLRVKQTYNITHRHYASVNTRDFSKVKYYKKREAGKNNL
jgi:hypothetical protein